MMLYDRRISLMDFVQDESGGWSWQESRRLWGRVEQKAQRNLFSAVGVGAKTVLFSLPPHSLNLGQALYWKGQHYHLTDINCTTPMEMQVTAADVTPVECTALRSPSGVGTAGYQGEPEVLCSFPAILVEKWAGYRQVDQYALMETTMVLVTPKAIELKAGDIITQAGREYVVRVPHRTADHQNEYELEGTEEV